MTRVAVGRRAGRARSYWRLFGTTAPASLDMLGAPRVLPPRVVVATLVFSLLAIGFVGCGNDEPAYEFDSQNPARGPGVLAGSTPTDPSTFTGGNDSLPEPRSVETIPTDVASIQCDAECRSFCASAGLENPVNAGLCTRMWGVGLESAPIRTDEACRRLFADTIGRFPTRAEVAETCEGRPWGDVVRDLMGREEFVRQQQIRWADVFRYDTETVSVERIFDMDLLVGKVYRGEVPYDQFAAIASAHPTLTRRFDTAGDRAEALFVTFMGRPPLGSERADIGRLYNLWDNGYYDHPLLGMRLPDAFVRFRCLDENLEPDPERVGECTSVLYGYNELILQPDIRVAGSDDDVPEMWSGLLTAQEWAQLQAPGRILSEQTQFWETAVDNVAMQYLGYEIGVQAPEVRENLVRYLLDNGGDIRSVHFALLTSAAYLQSTRGQTTTDIRWTYGPLKQAAPETWIDTIIATTGYDMTGCDHRITRPNGFIDNGSPFARSVVESTNWEFDEDGGVRTQYSSLARGLGGCPDNNVGGRFTIVSILTTATQLSFVDDVCNPTFEGTGVPASGLLPDGIGPDRAVDPELAAQIVQYQTQTFFSRDASDDELDRARLYGEECARSICTAEEFARPACFALLSSAEMLFY